MKRVNNRRPPRPKKLTAIDRRIAHLVATATIVFQEFGYDATSMEMIADRAGVTRRTVYNHFPNKEALFAKIVEASAQKLIETVELADDPTVPTEQQLVRYCEAIATTMIKPERLGVIRLLMDVSRRHLLKDLRGSPTEPFVAALSEHLAVLNKRGELHIPDTRRAAHILLGVSILQPQRLLIGLTNKRSIEPEIRKTIREAVEMFCQYYAGKKRSAKRAAR
jgi:AcrR family transcriptional regulator